MHPERCIHVKTRIAALWSRRPKRHEASSIRIRKRLQHHAVDHTEDRRTQSDPQREGGTDYCCPYWRLSQHADTVSHVLSEALHSGPAPSLARVFLNFRSVA